MPLQNIHLFIYNLITREHMKKASLAAKIKELKNEFEEQKNIFKRDHLITRRVGSFHGVLFLVTLIIGTCLELTSVTLRFDFDPLLSALIAIGVVFCLVFFLLCVIYSNIKFFLAKPNKNISDNNRDKNTLTHRLFVCNVAIFALYFITLIVFTTDVLIFVSGFCLLIYLGCYLSNKQYGYTSGFVRNQTYYLLLDSLEWEVDHLDDKDNVPSNLKLDELASKFTSIIEVQLKERQRDIVGDYFSTNDAAFSWIKSIKK